MTAVTAAASFSAYVSPMELELELGLMAKLFSLLAAAAVLAPVAYVITMQALRLAP